MNHKFFVVQFFSTEVTMPECPRLNANSYDANIPEFINGSQ